MREGETSILSRTREDVAVGMRALPVWVMGKEEPLPTIMREEEE
jgi:hypothetical protein